MRGLHEQGVADFDANFWSGFFLPQGPLAAIVARLNAAAVETLNTPFVQERLKGVGVTVVAPDRRSADYLKAFVESESGKWAATIKASGVSLD